jgi:hypothetical protein
MGKINSKKEEKFLSDISFYDPFGIEYSHKSTQYCKSNAVTYAMMKIVRIANQKAGQIVNIG